MSELSRFACLDCSLDRCLHHATARPAFEFLAANSPTCVGLPTPTTRRPVAQPRLPGPLRELSRHVTPRRNSAREIQRVQPSCRTAGRRDRVAAGLTALSLLSTRCGSARLGQTPSASSVAPTGRRPRDLSARPFRIVAAARRRRASVLMNGRGIGWYHRLTPPRGLDKALRPRHSTATPV